MTRNSQHGTQKPSAWYALGLKKKKNKKKHKKKNKKTLKQNPEAKYMLCTWLKNTLKIKKKILSNLAKLQKCKYIHYFMSS